MKTHAQVVVIGGGIAGCSILYHLTKLGYTDVVLLERNELTSGSTWHAAANIHGLHDNTNISKLQYYTMSLYRELEQETGQSCGVHQPGSIYLAQTKDREHQLRIQAAKARYFGVDFYELSPTEVKELHPLVDLSGVRCAFFETLGGHVDPSGIPHAYAQGARARGAEIYRFTPVLATRQRADGSWDVVTDKGSIHADAVVNAAGLWGREVGRLAGIDLPLMTMEHQYFVTEDLPALKALDRELPSVADRDGEYYLRQEGKGLLVGAYEKDGRFWAEHGTPLDFGHDLLPDDLERIEENILRACDRIEGLSEAGIKRVVNGPMIWSPDAAALFGPVPELRNYYCCNGIIPGFSQSGGLGLLMAQWIVEGEPELDLFPWDLARYGLWANKTYTKARALDCYSHRFKIHFPYEEREAGRPLRTRPIYPLQKALGAVFGFNYGWEHPLWFAKSSDEAKETYGFERQGWFDAVGQECRALRERVGLIDIANFAKYEIQGPGAGDWLDQVLANRVPRKTGFSCLAPLLSQRGGIAGDFTLTQLDTDHYLMVGSGMAERYHQRYFNAVPRPPSVRFESKTDAWCAVNVAGPQARALLSTLTETDLSNEHFPFMRSKRIKVAGVEVIALRVSFTGELGWELYCEQDQQPVLYQALLDAGEAFGLRPVGSRALLSLRIEKGYGSWGREYSPEYWPQEVGLARLIKLDKPAFLGREAYLAIKDTPAREQLVMLSLSVSHNADAVGSEPIFDQQGQPVGRVSSGSYGHSVGQSLIMGFIKSSVLERGDTQFNVAVLGLDHPATLLSEPAFDPSGSHLRS